MAMYFQYKITVLGQNPFAIQQVQPFCYQVSLAFNPVTGRNDFDGHREVLTNPIKSQWYDFVWAGT